MLVSFSLVLFWCLLYVYTILQGHASVGVGVGLGVDVGQPTARSSWVQES
jgi:hypothetical protein